MTSKKTIEGSKMDKQHHVDGGDSQVSPGFWSNPTRVLATALLTGAMAGLTVSAALAAGPSPAASSGNRG